MRARLPAMTGTQSNNRTPPPIVEVVIEIPRGSFLKRGSNGHLDFVSPFPCPYNYGSIHEYIGGEGDYLDAIVLGPRLPAGTRIETTAYGAVGLSERFMSDDKLVCDDLPILDSDRRKILRFFRFYAICKGILNRVRRQPGRSSCDGWGEASAAIARATPVQDLQRGSHPTIGF
jgi:inorganic pyrophosphatase